MKTNYTSIKSFMKSFAFINRHNIIIILISLVFILFGLLVYILSQTTTFNRDSFLYLFSGNFKYALGVSVLASTAGALIAYVNKGIGGTRSVVEESFNLLKLKNELISLRTKVDEFAKYGASEIHKVDLEPNERAELIENAKKRIIGNTLLMADTSLKNEVATLKHQVDINKHYSDMVYRLENEIDRLNRRGGVNLVIGTLIALAGILYLGFTVTSTLIVNDKLDYILHMAPRLSFVIVIELFAYFFLKLYKNGFDEVKYFQNELTNIDSKMLGIKFLKDVRNEELMGEVIKNLMATERNFILDKGQSTVSLEQQRLKNEEEKNVIDILKEITKIRR